MIHFSETKKTFQPFVFKAVTFILAFGFLGLVSSCEEDDEQETITPTSAFSVESQNFLEVTFTNASTNAVSYVWNFGDESGGSNNENPVHTYAEPGTYTVRLVAASASDDLDVSTMEVTVSDAVTPVAAFSTSADGLAVTFTNSSMNADTYAWDFGDENTSTEESPEHTYAEEGTYIVTLTVTSADGVESTVSEEITVADGVIPTAGFTSVANFLEVTFTNTSEDATSYSWDFGDSSGTSTEENPIYTYAAAGTYDVELTATSGDGVENTFSMSVTVTDAVAPTASYTSEASDLEVTFTNTSTNATSYSWDFGDGNSSTDENPVHTYASYGTYTVVLTATSVDDIDDTDSQSIEVAFTPMILNGSMNELTPINTGDNTDAWSCNPPSTLGDGSASPYDFWSNSALDSWLASATGDSNHQPGSSSTSYNTDRSIKFESLGRRAYQPITVEAGTTYAIDAGVRVNSTTLSGSVLAGTFYILDKAITDEETGMSATSTSLENSDIASLAVNATIGSWTDVTINFTTTTETEVILYFVPDGANTATKEIFLDDISIEEVSI